MIQQSTIATVVALGVVLAATTVQPAERATPEEIVAKVRAAAAHLADHGEAGLAIFDKADSEFVWKDSYIFVYDCAADVIAAHPVTESRGATISDLRGGDGGAFGIDLCAAAEVPGGSWAEYRWRRPTGEGDPQGLAYGGEHIRKVSYMLAVEDTPYQVGAGIFDETTPLDQLDALLAK
jgi:cytochrome c